MTKQQSIFNIGIGIANLCNCLNISHSECLLPDDISNIFPALHINNSYRHLGKLIKELLSLLDTTEYSSEMNKVISSYLEYINVKGKEKLIPNMDSKIFIDFVSDIQLLFGELMKYFGNK